MGMLVRRFGEGPPLIQGRVLCPVLLRFGEPGKVPPLQGGPVPHVPCHAQLSARRVWFDEHSQHSLPLIGHYSSFSRTWSGKALKVRRSLPILCWGVSANVQSQNGRL